MIIRVLVTSLLTASVQAETNKAKTAGITPYRPSTTSISQNELPASDR